MDAAIRHCFEELGLNRIEAFVTVGNNRSLNTLDKLGFKQEGILRDYEYTQGNFHDQVVLALLKRDWEN